MTDYLQCKTCKWWDTEWREGAMDHGRGIPEHWNMCMLLSGNDDRMMYGERYGMRSTMPATLAEATCEGEGIGGELLTSPDFGCVQHEPRENQDVKAAKEDK